jgi:hypothetical protein
MQEMMIFNIQNILFDVLKNGLSDAKVLKICEEKPKGKFVLIESIKEEALNSGRRKFNIVLNAFPDTFDYRVLAKMLEEVKKACNFEAFKVLDGFINFQLITSFISSNLEKGYESKLEFVCFLSESFN